MEYIGKSVCKGIAIGTIKVYKKGEQSVTRVTIVDTNTEVERYRQASNVAMDQLSAIYDKAYKEVGEDNAAIFATHQLMLEDEDYTDAIINMIEKQNVNAEYAVAKTGENFAEMFSSMESEYMQARAMDIKDISERLITVLMGSDNKVIWNEPVIIVADDLSPSETVLLDKSKVLAFVTRYGSKTSHTAILARTMNIPALIGVDISLQAIDGKIGAVDGESETLFVEPDESTMKKLIEKQEKDKEQKSLLLKLKGKESVTMDEKRINLYANVGNIGDIALALENDAEGIGLFRSEFIYMGTQDYPTEEEQFMIYKKAAELLADKKLIIRTCDIGADKQVDYFKMEREENPALGVRAIRLCLNRPDLFKTQLRALFRASMYGNISIMYPMIISEVEVFKIKDIVNEVKIELKQQGIPFHDDVEQGIMIETPAAALISDVLAKEVDFFSIGTNDLTQYTLAADRQNSNLEPMINPHHEGVLRLIEMTVKNAHKENIWVGICGELGADLSMTERFIKMGVDELSVSPGMILPVKQKIRETSYR